MLRIWSQGKVEFYSEDLGLKVRARVRVCILSHRGRSWRRHSASVAIIRKPAALHRFSAGGRC
jgi:hypothetical protein